jgi:hypothetical protein
MKALPHVFFATTWGLIVTALYVWVNTGEPNNLASELCLLGSFVSFLGLCLQRWEKKRRTP